MRAGEVVSGVQTSGIVALLDFNRFIDGLVYPVPDGTTDSRRTAFDAVPVFSQVTDGITHGMCIFADEHRLVERIDILIHPAHAGIHLRVEVTETVTAEFLAVAGAFVVYGTGIKALGCIVAGLEVVTASTFIAQTPEDHTRMVAVTQHHAVDAVHKGRNP